MTTMNEAHKREKENQLVKCTDKSCSSYSPLNKTKCMQSGLSNNRDVFPHYCDRAKAHKVREAAPELLQACKGAIAALSQNKTFPADIEAAKAFLKTAINKTL